jgi:hypothetical protein
MCVCLRVCAACSSLCVRTGSMPHSSVAVRRNRMYPCGSASLTQPACNTQHAACWRCGEARGASTRAVNADDGALSVRRGARCTLGATGAPARPNPTPKNCAPAGARGAMTAMPNRRNDGRCRAPMRWHRCRSRWHAELGGVQVYQPVIAEARVGAVTGELHDVIDVDVALVRAARKDTCACACLLVRRYARARARMAAMRRRSPVEYCFHTSACTFTASGPSWAIAFITYACVCLRARASTRAGVRSPRRTSWA